MKSGVNLVNMVVHCPHSLSQIIFTTGISMDTEAIYEDINEQIARVVMGWGEESLSDVDIPLPNYAGDRNCAATVVEKLWSLELLSGFSDALQEKYDRAKVHGNMAEFLIWCTPGEICEAALVVVNQ